MRGHAWLAALVGLGQMLRADAEHHLALSLTGHSGPAAQAGIGSDLVVVDSARRRPSPRPSDAAGEKFIAGRADEAGDEARRRVVVEFLRRADLLDAAVVHHHDAVGQRHRLDLVVGDVDRGGADRLVHLLDLGAHLHAQLGVEVGQRLVEQEDLRVAHDGAAHRDALALAAGQRLRLAVQQRRDVEDARGLVDPAA